MVTDFPGQEVKERGSCVTCLRGQGRTILTVLGSSLRYPTRASPILPLEHKPMRPLGSIPVRH